MNFEKYTDRARGFIQSAQSLALREGHQQFTPEHLLKVLLDDPEGLADLVLAGVNQALKNSQDLMQSKLGGAMGDLKGLGLPGL